MASTGYGAVESKVVEFKGHNGDSISGYLSVPADGQRRPGVIVISEVFGLVNHIRELAFKFAGNGYIALAPDLHHREGPGMPEDIAAKVREEGGVPDDRCIGDLDGAAAYLKAMSNCTGKLGVIGFCSGGRQVVLYACNTKNLSAAVTCYGGRVVMAPDQLTPRMPKAPIDMVPNLSCPILCLSGVEDQNPSPAMVEQLRQALEQNHKTFEMKSYDGAGHAFFADYRPSYRQAAAVDGWQRVFAWFGQHLA